MPSYSLGLRVIFHFEALFNVGCVVCGVAALVFYIRHQRHGHIYSTLVFHILTTILFGLTLADNYFRQVLSIYGLHITIPLGYSWRVLLLIFPAYFVYVSGATLALDRVLALTFPFKHVAYKISRNLTILGVAACVVNVLVMFTSNVIQPGSDGSDNKWNSSTTHTIYQVTYEFFEVVFLAEVVFHIVFCVQFYRYDRAKTSAGVKQHAQKTNHITLFQVTTQSLLCLLPKILSYINEFLFANRIQWIRDYFTYYSFFLTLNVFSVSFFIAYRFRPKRKIIHSVAVRQRGAELILSSSL